MKILVVTQYFYPETFRLNSLCEDLVKRGHDVSVLTAYPQYPQGKIYDGYGFKTPYEKVWNGVKVHRVKVHARGKTPFGLLRNCIMFVTSGKKWVKKCEEKFDLVFAIGLSPVTIAIPGVFYKKKFSTPLFFNIQDLWPESVQYVLHINNKILIGILNKVVDYIYTNCDKLFCSSKGYIEEIKKRGVDENKLLYWPQFCDAPNTKAFVEPTLYNNDAFKIVFTGNLGTAQGLDILIKAINLLKEENIICYLVGDGRDRERLEKIVKENNIEDKVIFVGKVSEHEANEYTYFADCAYMSLIDNYLMDLVVPAKLQSYLACEVPIIGAVGGQCADIITNSCCGIASKRNETSVVNAIRELMQKTPTERTQMGLNAKTYFNTNYNKEALISQIEEEYSKI